ncbi:MAG TPA: branched-chain amino acid ABC transporter permease [Methylomirabilota bacterium]|nr:branched-chain amino acid ABC transporter permease [Methylomirabilota bacterium]
MTGAGRALRPALLVAAAAAALSGCVDVDAEKARLCRTVLPALEPHGRIVVDTEERDPAVRDVVRIAYSVDAGDGVRRGTLRCAFGGGRLDAGRLDLVAVDLDDRLLGDARLLFLKRFWLGDPEASSEGVRRLELPPADPLVAVPVGPASGYFLQQLMNAAPVGAIYGLLALAYAFVYGLIGRINLAFGEVAVIGAFALVNVLLLSASGLGTIAAVALAVLAAAVAAGAAGAAIGRLVFRPLSTVGHRPFLIATVGVAIAVGEGLRILSGSRDRWMQPILNEPVVLFDGGYRVTATAMQGLEVAVTLSVVAAVIVLMTRTRFGRAWRAVADDPLMSRMLGVDTARIAMATFVVSAALAGVAGALTALHYGHASPYAGLLIGLKALVAALLGGIGSLVGAALGGLLVGLGETLWSAYLPLAHRDIAVLAVLVAVLVFRPNGLFGRTRPTEDTAEARWRRLG